LAAFLDIAIVKDGEQEPLLVREANARHDRPPFWSFHPIWSTSSPCLSTLCFSLSKPEHVEPTPRRTTAAMSFLPDHAVHVHR